MVTRKNAKIHPVAHRRMKALAKVTGKRLDFMYDEALFDFLEKHDPKKVLRKDHDEE